MAKLYSSMSCEELQAELSSVKAEYESLKAQGLSIDMSRGKPGSDQLDISDGMLKVFDDGDFKCESGVDVRNYGLLDGIPECKKLFADLLDVKPENVIVGGNSSLSMMFDFVSQCMYNGAGFTPWAQQGKVKFLCPCPGYDRHFAICEFFGIEMINIPMTSEGPDMDAIEEAVKDSSVKGMFCVPKYSNPQGITFSAETVKRIANLTPAANDFRIIWDNAYCVHDLTDTTDELVNIFDVLPERNANMVIEVASTSKISYPGAGVACLVSSVDNIKVILKRLTIQSISYDKVNMLRHVKFFKNVDGIKEHMKLHAKILKPKFDAVLDTLNSDLNGLGIAEWNVPNGGYFISLDVTGGSASRVGVLCKDAGVTLTNVGATFPYGKDPSDSNIRIAPTFPTPEVLMKAVKVLTVSVKLACLEELCK
ncbi:MAG: aminotransferase class I/II-fold pyridoxal phosphate-dependent enzyme [Clostridia bacterium]|nr:aminotransferase class I/II-fold pyridoxal phosphate-dependent enzyme [Clostridia bacterium]MBO5434140.1 aminotransferase class I/II-fold pyridoxal phosphate-dependent enzyme [Clostridia bacterium]